MNRRGFLQSCLAAATSPYVVTAAGVLMPVRKLMTVGWDLAIAPDSMVIIEGNPSLCSWFKVMYDYERAIVRATALPPELIYGRAGG